MANYDDDDLDNIDDRDVEEGEATEGGQARPAGNRNFLIAAGILGGIFLLLVIALLVVALVVLPQRQAAQQAANNAIATQNAEAAVAATLAAEEAVGSNAQPVTPSSTPTASLTPVPATPTFTQVVAQASNTPTVTVTTGPTAQDARTATVAALLTQAAEAKITRTITATGAAGGVVTSTSLPKTGFAEDVGLPGLFGLSLVLIAVIVLVRRLRISTGS